MKSKRIWLITCAHLVLVGACSTNPQRNRVSPILKFEGIGVTELGVVSVMPSIDRGSVEWHLVADKLGDEQVTKLLEQHCGMKRIRNDEEFDVILETKFIGITGKDRARNLWKRYKSATYSGLEDNNATIIFFDSEGLSVVAWPALNDLTQVP